MKSYIWAILLAIHQVTGTCPLALYAAHAICDLINSYLDQDILRNKVVTVVG